jgi:hypothetical protein
MKLIIEWLRELFDPTSLLVFMLVFGYILLMDAPRLKRQNWRREANLIKYLTWVGLGGFSGLMILQFFH